MLWPIQIGADIGQVHDPSAVCVSEAVSRPTGRYRYREPKLGYFNKQGEYVANDYGADEIYKTQWYIRFIQRLPLGLGYPEQAIYLANLLCSPNFKGRRLQFRMDITGVGRPVFQMLQEEIVNERHIQPSEYMQLLPITLVNGDAYNTKTGSLGKGYMVSTLQAILQTGRLHGPDTREMRATLDEMKVFERTMSKKGNDLFGAERGMHDDLVIAAGLSCLHDPHKEKIGYSKKRVY